MQARILGTAHTALRACRSMPWAIGSSTGHSEKVIVVYRWIEAGKFLTGFSAVGLVAVPSILAHAEYITFGAMLIELCAAASIGLMVVVYDYSQHDSYSSFY